MTFKIATHYGETVLEGGKGFKAFKTEKAARKYCDTLNKYAAAHAGLRRSAGLPTLSYAVRAEA